MSAPILQDTVQLKLQDFGRQCQQSFGHDSYVMPAYTFDFRNQGYIHPNSGIDTTLLAKAGQQVCHRNYLRKMAQINLTLTFKIN